MSKSPQTPMIRWALPTLQVLGSLESDVDIEYRKGREGSIGLPNDPGGVPATPVGRGLYSAGQTLSGGTLPSIFVLVMALNS